MFLLRGAFWVAVVAVFTPGAPADAPQNGAINAQALIGDFRAGVLSRLSRVRMDFAAQDRAQERAARGPPA